MISYQIKPRPLEPKAKPIRDHLYKKWVRTQPCSVIGCQRTDIEFAHTGSKGKGSSVKACDLDGIPLCAYHHRNGAAAHHRHPEARWAHLHGLSLAEIRAGLRALYFGERETGMR